jgi:hypothetical protein
MEEIAAMWSLCCVRITNINDSRRIRKEGTRDGLFQERWESGFCGNAAAGVLVIIVVCELVCGGNARELKLMGSNRGVRRERRGNVRRRYDYSERQLDSHSQKFMF